MPCPYVNEEQTKSNNVKTNLFISRIIIISFIMTARSVVIKPADKTIA